mgnify:CR=1 FL=1
MMPTREDSMISLVMPLLKTAAVAEQAVSAALTFPAQIWEIFSETFSGICLVAAEEEAAVRTMAQ